MSEGELWDHLCSASDLFPEMYKAYSHLRSKNWVVRSGLQYGTDFVAYRHHPALVHSEFAVVVVPEGAEFGGRFGRLKVWSDLLCALRASGSVAKTLLVLTISSSICELGSPDCLEQLVVHERKITRWIAQQCREQRCEPCRVKQNKEQQGHTRETVVLNYWGVILGFTVKDFRITSSVCTSMKMELRPCSQSGSQQVPATIPNFQGKPEDLWLAVWLPLLKQERKGFDSIIMLISKNI
ncbi:hypothetical protein QYE76_071877 [Lolium multiflorum]|uniref:tRNA-intron lyase n=1 Tax=Lolium multiflorum TaxID=4521 RepID=A0AAD8SMX7_LOLMU|nr:hypothetical protein QYE76_071877 [Lolium multiflorum]